MSQVNVSGFGTTVTVTASATFPQGVVLSQFADDADSLDIPELAVAESGMGLNGTHVVWSKPAVIDLTVNIVPTSNDDVNLAILLEANRVAEGKRGARDQITFVINYPDGRVATLSEGIIVSGIPVNPITQSGRAKTRPYKFRFTQVSKSGE